MPPDPDAPYVFRTVRSEDFPDLERWFGEPHVAQWWEAADIELEAIAQAMKTGESEPMVAEWEGRPIAYLQTYDPHREPHHPYGDQPVGTCGLDIAIGLPEETGKGHGSRIVACLARQLFEKGWTRILVDPHPDNTRAIRSYEKAGFRFIDHRHSLYGPAHLMVLEGKIEEMDRP